jgi:hypothetical protein
MEDFLGESSLLHRATREANRTVPLWDYATGELAG